MPEHRKRRHFLPRNLLGLSIDCLTLLPFRALYSLLAETSHDNFRNPKIELFRVKAVIRLYRVVHYFYSMNNTAGLNQLQITFWAHICHVIVISVPMSALWYAISCYKCKRRNWTSSLKLYNMDASNPFNWFVLCCTQMSNLFSHNAPGII